MSTKKPEVILIRESAVQSWLKDAGTYAMFVGLTGTGWLLDSAAMQWAGLIVAFLAVLYQSGGEERRCTMTIDQARKRLDEIECGEGG